MEEGFIGSEFNFVGTRGSLHHSKPLTITQFYLLSKAGCSCFSIFFGEWKCKSLNLKAIVNFWPQHESAFSKNFVGLCHLTTTEEETNLAQQTQWTVLATINFFSGIYLFLTDLVFFTSFQGFINVTFMFWEFCGALWQVDVRMRQKWQA